jgi:predicted Na+-dependent transporter
MADLDKPSRLAELRTSARGWHGVQLAVIGFIGLCGVLQGGRPDNPKWLQVWAGILAIAALVLACVATFLVARVAWPLYGGGREVTDDDVATVEREGRRIKQGLALTFASVAVLALGTATGWWPQDEQKGLVSVEVANGATLCGTLGAANPGNVTVSVDGRSVALSLQDVTAIRSVDSC